MDIGNRLKELRTEKHVTQKEVASTLGLSITCYAGYEQGYRFPDLDILAKIADYFSVSTDYLLGREDDFGQNIGNLDLSENERLLLLRFRRLSEERQLTVLDTILYMTDSGKNKNSTNKSIS